MLSVTLRFTVAITAVAVLSQARPAWPEFPSSLDAPLTVTAVEQTIVLVLWVVACLLAAGLFLSTMAIVATKRPRPRRGGELLATRSGTRQVRTNAAAPAPRAAFTVAAPAAPAAPAETSVDAPRPPPAPSLLVERPLESPPAPAHAGVTISLLGALTIEGINKPRREATKELLAFLALNREATRDQLLEALWPGQDPRRTRPRLWQSVSEAGRLLGDAFIRARDRYRLDLEHVHLDTVELDRHMALADAAEDPAIERSALESALALWRGDPLAGADYPWADGAIRHLQATHVNLLERVSRARLDAGDAPAALEAAERGIAAEELHEGLWRLALQAEADLGQRDALNTRYEALRQLLDDRLGLEPNSATTALYRRLLGQG